MKKVLIKFKNLFLNIWIALVGIFIRRDRKIWLFGAWMGQRFADNSRFLFQYLHDHKDKYGIEQVIWVTDNAELLKELRAQGYTTVLKKTKEGRYWHLKAGVHVVCNMPARTGQREGDILGELSAGAVKIQLWHGVGIKAVGNLRVQRQAATIQNKIRNIVLGRHFLGNKVFSPGCWDGRYQLATGEENARVAHDDLGADTAKIFIGNYPRLIDNPITLPSEKAVLERLQTFVSGKRVLLYCPTFREKKQDDSQYYDPIDIEGFRKFLEDNDLLWVEKRHFSSTFEVEAHKSEAIYYIDSDFDINLLYDYIDVLITDYSSASSDCIYKGIKIISFIPDKNEYEHDERGFVCEYSKYYPGDLTVSIDELEKAIQRCFSKDYYDTQTISKYKNCRSFLYGDHPEGLEWTMEGFLKKIEER